jgi:hypothetical protein
MEGASPGGRSLVGRLERVIQMRGGDLRRGLLCDLQ